MYRTRRSRSHVPADRNQRNEPGCATGGFVSPVTGWGEGGSADWDTVAGRRGHGKGRGSGERMSQGQRQTLPGEPSLPLHVAGQHLGGSQTPRTALTPQPLFSEDLSPRVSPGAEGHSLSQCRLSPRDPPQIGVFLARIFALGEKIVYTENWGFGGDGLRARPRFKVLPA